MVDIVVTGVSGRMGAEILRVIRAHPDARFAGGTVRSGASTVELASRLGGPVDDSLEAALDRGADVVIDFTSPAATLDHARICAGREIPLVVGTTGLCAADRASIDEAARKIPLLLAPNMSVGMNLLFRLVASAAKALESYDVEIVEAHHRHKKDAPSGSALRLAEEVAAARGVDLDQVGSFGRHGIVGERPQGEIGVHAVRGGDVAGDHTVLFLGDGERLELSHRASSRDAFASGAVRAATWIVGKDPGIYSMQDVLGFGERR